MHIALDDLVPAIHALYEQEFERPCHFHLAPCAKCGAPTFQYPCPSCDTWNDASGPWSRDEQIAPTTREQFVAKVERDGGIGAWYFGKWRRSVAYTETFGFKERIEGLVDRAKQIEWPSPAEVWDAVHAGMALPSRDFNTTCRERWRAEAVARNGEGVLATIKATAMWPECESGKAIVRACAERSLSDLGLTADATPSP